MLAFLALSVLLNNSIIEVPPSRWKAIDLVVPQHETLITGQFQVTKGSRVQVIIADREQAERFHRGRSFKPIYTSGFAEEGSFRTRIREAGEYVLLIDNRIEGRYATLVRMSLEMNGTHRFQQSRELPPERRRAVVALSLLFFGFVVVFSASQFLKRR